MKKLGTILLTLFMAAGLLTACQDNAAEDKQASVVTEDTKENKEEVETEEDKEEKEDKETDGSSLEMTAGTWKTGQTIQPFLYEKFVEDNEQVEVKPFTNPGDMKTALLAGDLDFTGTTWVTAIMAASKGEPVKVVATMTEKCSALVVGKDSGIESVEDLKGKTIAYVPGTMHHILLLETLTKAGLDPNEDVTLQKIDFFDMGQALASNSIDAFLSGEPYPSIAEIDGYGRVLQYPYFDDSIGYINAAMITTEKEIDENPEKIQRLVDMHIQASKYYMDNEDEWIDKAAEFGTERKYLEKSIDNMELSWDITEDTKERVSKLAEKMKELELIDEVPDIDAMFDTSFIEQSSFR